MIYANKVNGAAEPAQHFTGTVDYFTLSSTINFLATGPGTASQNVLDNLIEIISTKGAPILMLPPYVSSVTGNYTLNWLSEKTGAWVASDLLSEIVANQTAGNGFTLLNTSVTITTTTAGGDYPSS